jgi:hypothetical protein
MLAGNCDLDLRQFLSQNMHDRGQPFRLASAQKSQRQRPLFRVSGAPGGGRGGLNLHQREPRVVEKHAAGRGQLDPARAAGHQHGADLHLQVMNLAAYGGLRGVQPALGRQRDAALLGDRHEVAQVPQLHKPIAMPARYGAKPTKSFLSGRAKPKSARKALQTPAAAR